MHFKGISFHTNFMIQIYCILYHAIMLAYLHNNDISIHKKVTNPKQSEVAISVLNNFSDLIFTVEESYSTKRQLRVILQCKQINQYLRAAFLLVNRYSLLVARCSLRVTRYKPTRHFLQSTHCFLQSTRCFLQSTRYCSFTTYSLLTYSLSKLLVVKPSCCH